MKRGFAILFLLVCSIKLVVAQTQINGRIQDEQTGDSIPFATLGINGKAITVANSDGLFVLPGSTTAKITVSCLGYQSIVTGMSLDQSPITIKLRKVEIGLNEVVINSNPSISIMDSAYRKAHANTTKKHYGKAFMRQLSSLNDTFTGISESFFDAQYSNYAILGWSPTQARFSKSRQNITLSNFNFISFASIGYLSTSVFATPLKKNATQIYNFKLEGLIKDGADDVAIINCQIKDKKATPNHVF